ncbi:hypothetical protein U9M48_014994, partial [Paspalum notatum var. saurae]
LRQLPVPPVQGLAAAGDVVQVRGLLAARSGHRDDLLGRPPLSAEPEHLDHLGHGRPTVCVALRAQHGGLDHGAELLRVEPSGKARVREALPLAALHQRRRPLHDLALDAAGELFQRPARADEFQEKHAKAVDVAALGDLPPHGVLRRQVAQRALHPCRQVRHAVGDEFGEPEVGDLGNEVRVQQHVARLDVPVYDVRVRLVVQWKESIIFGGAWCVDDDSREALGGADGYGNAACPVEGLMLMGGGGAALGVQVREQAVVGHVVVDDEALVAAGVETAEAEKILVPDTAQDLHLDGELHLRLGRHRLQPLHRDLNTRGRTRTFKYFFLRMHPPARQQADHVM